MSSPFTMYNTSSQESLTSDMSTVSIRPTKHVRFASQVDDGGRRSPDALSFFTDSFAESYKHWTPGAMGTFTMPLQMNLNSTRNNSQHRQSSIRHAIPSGTSRRESVEGFDDMKRRWSVESLLSEEAFAVDDE